MADLLWTKPRMVGGVLVAPPTVRSLFRAFEVFGAEIGAVREARSKIGDSLSVDVAVSPFLVPDARDRLLYVLEDSLCGAGDVSDDALHATTRSVVGVLGPNLPRIEALLGDPTLEIVAEPGAGDDVLYILGCADKYHIDPRTVMDWPLGLFLDVVDAFSAPPQRPQDAAASEAFIGSILPTITSEDAGVPSEQTDG